MADVPISEPQLRGRSISEPQLRGRSISEPQLRGRSISEPQLRGRSISEPQLRGRSDPIMQALGSVYDPCCREKNISVVDMGLVRSIARDGDGTRVELILTTGWCPFAATLLTTIEERVREVNAAGDVQVEIVWDEPWTTDRLSEDARRKLRFLPDPSAVADPAAYAAAARRPAPSPAVAEPGTEDQTMEDRR